MPHIKPRNLHSQHGVGYHGSFLGVAGEALALNDIVVATGYSGDRIKFSKADANVDGLDSGVMGIADHAAPSGGTVRVVSHKLITGVNTVASEGAGYPLYLSDTAGGWSVASGASPIIVGSVLSDDASTGAVVIAPSHVAAKAQASGVITAPATATTVLTAADSGKTILMTPNACIVTLPAPAVGLHFRFIQAGAYATAINQIHVTTPNTDFFVGHVVAADSDDGNVSDNDSNDFIKFGTGSLAGDNVEIIGISATQWFVTGTAQTGDGDSIAFSDS